MPDSAAGYQVVQVRMIFCPNVHSGHMLHGRHLAYVQWFTTPKGPQKDNNMYSVQCLLTSEGTCRGDVIDILSIAHFVQLIPRFGRSVSSIIDCENSMEIVKSYYINSFTAKEIFQTVWWCSYHNTGMMYPQTKYRKHQWAHYCANCMGDPGLAIKGWSGVDGISLDVRSWISSATKVNKVRFPWGLHTRLEWVKHCGKLVDMANILRCSVSSSFLLCYLVVWIPGPCTRAGVMVKLGLELGACLVAQSKDAPWTCSTSPTSPTSAARPLSGNAKARPA